MGKACAAIHAPRQGYGKRLHDSELSAGAAATRTGSDRICTARFV